MSDKDRPGHPPAIADPGLQSERTYLAWQRTGLTFAGTGALLVHAAGALHNPLAFVPGALGLAAGAVILLRALLRYQSIAAAARGERDPASPWLAVMLAVIVVVLGITGLIILLAS